ncbi:hypothetical protein [Streptomyces sp. NPDC057253]|uniref:hypothetical protein n=1 Tax=Streptomyces sp. NPDC057253 TaxID=3346069 RepID=UPI003630FF14
MHFVDQMVRRLMCDVDLPGACFEAGCTGRDSILVHLREESAYRQRVAVLALDSRGAEGMTQLALEYAYRLAGEYEFTAAAVSPLVVLLPDVAPDAVFRG